MANLTTEAPTGTKNGTLVIAILVPSVLIIVLLALVIMSVFRSVQCVAVRMSELTRSNRRRAFIVPRLVRGDADVKEQRLKTRQDELESHIKSQHFYDWLASQKEKNPESLQASDPLW